VKCCKSEEDKSNGVFCMSRFMEDGVRNGDVCAESICSNAAEGCWNLPDGAAGVESLKDGGLVVLVATPAPPPPPLPFGACGGGDEN
jgi:hypothetical protein